MGYAGGRNSENWNFSKRFITSSPLGHTVSPHLMAVSTMMIFEWESLQVDEIRDFRFLASISLISSPHRNFTAPDDHINNERPPHDLRRCINSAPWNISSQLIDFTFHCAQDWHRDRCVGNEIQDGRSSEFLEIWANNSIT